MSLDQPPAPTTFQNLVLRDRPFQAYTGARFFTSFSMEALNVAVGWQVYDMTRSSLMLGFIGLVQFLPSLLLVLVTGAVTDRFSRRLVMAGSVALFAFCAGSLLVFTLAGNDSVVPILVVMTLVGVARAFYSPSNRALINAVVSRQLLAPAIAFGSSSARIAQITGSIAGGLLYGATGHTAYSISFALFAIGLVMLAAIPAARPPPRTGGSRWEELSAGFRYVRGNRMLLGAISLDLFAGLLGGANTLLPVFARDVLNAGSDVLGLLRASPGIGAIAVALFLAWRPLARSAGLIMLLCVGAFGAVTAGFGLSRYVWLSMIFLAAAGGFDVVSVILRETLVQLATPDGMRGRVSAINGVFISASNEMADFRAGIMAAVIGAVPAVVVGGLGAMAVAVVWAWAFPELLRAGQMDGRETPPPFKAAG